MDGEAQQVWNAVNAIYAGFLSGDRDAIDRNIAPDATVPVVPALSDVRRGSAV